MTEPKNTKQQKEIDCGGGRKIVVTGKDLTMAFQVASIGKSGDALVEALLKSAPGSISTITRYKDGKREDGLDGQAAVQVFDDKGRQTLRAHYKNDQPGDTADEVCFQQFDGETGRLLVKRHYLNGRLNDTPTEPAVMMAYNKNEVIWERYNNGERSDGPNGEAAVEKFLEDGTLVSQARYRNNQKNDGLNGEPGYQRFDKNGKVTLTEHWKDGYFVGKSGIKNFIAKKLHLQK